MADEKRFVNFGAFCLEEVKKCILAGSPIFDAEVLADKATDLGLISRVEYDAEQHGHIPEAEDGDLVYYWGDKTI